MNYADTDPIDDVQPSAGPMESCTSRALSGPPRQKAFSTPNSVSLGSTVMRGSELTLHL